MPKISWLHRSRGMVVPTVDKIAGSPARYLLEQVAPTETKRAISDTPTHRPARRGTVWPYSQRNVRATISRPTIPTPASTATSVRRSPHPFPNHKPLSKATRWVSGK